MTQTVTTIPFTDEKYPEVLRMSKAALKEASAGKNGLAKSAKAEIARRAANRATAKAA